MEKVKTKLDEAKEGWNKIGTRKKIILVVLVSSIALFAYLYTSFMNKSEYVTLFSNLEFSDSGNIVRDLEQKGIKYKLEENGTKILIDEKKVDKYRIELAMEGNMPESSHGFEIFDDMGLMVTEDDRKIMYQRALAGELQRSIMSLESINSAKVNLVISEKSIFDTHEKPASASIIIDIKPNEKINDSMIKGIAALVSGAVSNLPDENIKIIDSKGNLLSNILVDKANYDTQDIANQHQKVKEDFEHKIQNNLNDLLGTAFGRDKIKVSVFADLDFDSEETTNIEYREPVIRSEQIDLRANNINDGDLSGLIGENTSNVFEGLANDSESFSRTTNNELSTETKTIIKAPGKVNKITTSVVFDGTLSDDRSRAIQNIVKTATGFDEERGDQITVEGVLFDRTYEAKLEAELAAAKAEAEANKTFLDKYGEYLKFGLLAAFGLIILASLIGLLSSKRKKGQLEQDTLLEYEMQENLGLEEAVDMIEDKIEVQPDLKKKKAVDYAQENPQLAADLIKAWMKD